MEAIGYAVALALMSLVPRLGEARAKEYGDAVARVSVAQRVDPWALVAIGRIETNWNADNMGGCCGGLMSINWAGWTHYAERRGLATDRRSLQQLARDGTRSIQIAGDVLATLKRMCGGGRLSVLLSAYQSGACRSNRYGRMATRLANRYRGRYTRLARSTQPPVARVLSPLTYSFGEPGPAPLPLTGATAAIGP